MNSHTILVAGLGNIFCADDAFGVEVVGQLRQRPRPPQVQVVDVGIRSLDLAYTLLEHAYELVILADTVRRGGDPGTVYVIEPELEPIVDADQQSLIEAHAMEPVQMLQMVYATASHLPCLRLVGCEPQRLNASEGSASDLSPPVRAAVDEAVNVIDALIEGHLVSARECCDA